MPLQLPKSQGPTVDPSAAPTVRVRPSMDTANFGGGQGVEQAAHVARGLSGDVASIAFREEMRAQDAQANKLDTQLSQLEEKRRGELYAVQGEKTLEAHGKMLQDYDKEAAEILKGATSNAVRDRVTTSMERRRIALEGTTKGYVRGQMLQHEEDMVTARVKAEGDNAIQSYSDPVRVTMALNEQETAIRRHGALSGKPKEWVAQKVAEVNSRTVRDVIFRALEKNEDIRAKEYLEAGARDFLKGDDLAKVEQAVEKWSILGKATRTTDELAKLPTLSEARAKMKEMSLSDEVREKTDSMLVREFALKERADEQFHDKQMSASINNIVQRFKSGQSAELLVGPQWNDLNGADQLKLEGLVDDLNKPEGVKTKANLFVKLHGMTQAQLAGYTEEKFISEFLTGLGKEDYNHARKLWEDSKKQSPEEFRGGLKDRDSVLDAMKGVGIGALSKDDTFLTVSDDKKKSDALYRFMGRMAEEEASWKTRHDGKPPKPEEYRALAENLALREARNVTFKRYDFGIDPLDSDEKRRLFDLTPDELNTEEFDIPPDLKTEFFNLARSKGGIPQSIDVAGFEEKYRGRLNRAFVAWIGKESDQAIQKILAGK